MSIRAGSVALSVAVLFTFGSACGSADVVPRVDLSEGLPAQRAFAALQERWEHAEWEAILAMGGELDRQIAAHPNDPSTQRARAMRAIVTLERGDLAAAFTRAQALSKVEGEGATRDMVNVVLGSLERRSGRPGRALATLDLLFNKVIDPPARAVLNRELVLAAVGSRKFDRAALYLRALLKQSGGPLRGFAERETAELTRRLPAAAALDVLREEVASEEPDRWFSSLLTQYVAAEVKAKQDPRLARDLLSIAVALLGDDADAVARVAAKGAGVRLERNTVGLLMPLRSDDLSRRGVEVASGLALALGIPGSATKLVIRDDQRDVAKVDETLALLNADGAAVIVAGFDTRESDLALAYAERTNVPLVLLRPPSRPVKGEGPVFVLGESPATVRGELVRAHVARGKKRVAMLVEERTVADLSPDIAAALVAEQPCGASLEFAKKAGADALILDGGSRCTKDAFEAAGTRLPLAFGLDAALGSGQRGLVATAGIFPILGKPASDALIELYRRREKHDPSWWVALGHDAGLIVKDAVLGLPSEDDGADAAVAVRKRLVTDAIAKAEGSLWTTDAKGFDGARIMKRTLSVTERKLDAAPKKR